MYLLLMIKQTNTGEREMKTIKVNDIVTSTRGQKRGRVVQFTGDKTIVTVEFFDGTVQDFKAGNIRKA